MVIISCLIFQCHDTLAQQIDWRPAAKECQAQTEKLCVKIGGASCGGWWDKTARCTIERVWPGKVPTWVVDAAIAQVQADRKGLCNICGPDPVAETIRRAVR